MKGDRMTTKLEKMARELNDEFRTDLKAVMAEKFDVEIETGFNFLSGTIYSVTVSGEPFTQEQLDFIKAYEEGYLAAMLRVRRAAFGMVESEIR
jgi:hypothetical protein